MNDTTVTLRLDLTDYVLRPPVVDYLPAARSEASTSEDDALGAARGVAIGLAFTLPFWVMILLITL